MRKIRKGEDISVHWPILTNGKPLSLDGRDLTLFIKSQYNVAKQFDFTTEDNVVVFTFPGTEQQMLGNYSLTLWENYGKAGQTAVDCCEAFTLVACTCEEDSGDEGLDTGTVDLESSSIEVGINGAGGGSLPAGGTAGQVLTKTTDGADWQDAPAGGTLPFKVVTLDFNGGTQIALTDEQVAELDEASMLVVQNSEYNAGLSDFFPKRTLVLLASYYAYVDFPNNNKRVTRNFYLYGSDQRFLVAQYGMMSNNRILLFFEDVPSAASISDEPIANAEESPIRTTAE